jgi:hypothetical protein
MTVDLPVDEAELELLVLLVGPIVRGGRAKGLSSPAYKKTAAALFPKLSRAYEGVLTALMRASEPRGDQ